MGRLGAPPGGAGMYGGWMGRVEVLAPAGTPDALRAAIAAGADAVYVGLGTFNARAANGGFSLGELADGCALAHSRAARVYVTLNVCLHDRELLVALELASRAIEAGADALDAVDSGPGRPPEEGDALRRAPPVHAGRGAVAVGGAPGGPRVGGVARDVRPRAVRRRARVPCADGRGDRGVLSWGHLHLLFGRLRLLGPDARKVGQQGRLHSSPVDSHTSCRTAGAASSPGARGSGAARARVTGCCAPATTWGSAMWASWSAPESRPSRSRGG